MGVSGWVRADVGFRSHADTSRPNGPLKADAIQIEDLVNTASIVRSAAELKVLGSNITKTDMALSLELFVSALDTYPEVS